MIDLHSHYLPDVDDGAPTMEASLDMLRTAAADGITHMVATPHQRHPAGYDVSAELARERLAAVKAAAAEAGVPVELSLSAEIHYSEGIPEGLADGTLLPLGEGSRYFLFELPVTTVPGNLREMIFAFQTAGCYPVLAHPERNFEVMEKPKKAALLREQGVLLQITAQSITGEFGRKSRAAAKKLLKWGVADVIASDAHNPDRRPPGLSEAVRRAAKWVGAERAEAMVTEIPRRILAGKEV
ncbi:MAG: CpsB/CapC family capsule biosynthesis tyrosine phosphatase [Planctomycetota bacterium]